MVREFYWSLVRFSWSSGGSREMRGGGSSNLEMVESCNVLQTGVWLQLKLRLLVLSDRVCQSKKKMEGRIFCLLRREISVYCAPSCVRRFHLIPTIVQRGIRL